MPTLVKSLQAFRAEANARYPDRDKTSDGWIGDTAHAARESDHNPDERGFVHAYDLDEDLDGNQADSAGALDFLAEHIRTSRDHRVKYVIYEGRIFAGRFGPKPWNWRPYEGTSPHDKHMHVSVLDDYVGENDVSPWFPQEDDMPTADEIWNHPIKNALKPEGSNMDPAHELLTFAHERATKCVELVEKLSAAVLAIPGAVWDAEIYEQINDVNVLARQMLGGAHFYGHQVYTALVAPAEPPAAPG
jgi:hypothetical protein